MKKNAIWTRTERVVLGSMVLGVALASGVSAQYGVSDGQWRFHGGDQGHTRYAALDQITPENFGDLKIAWTWDSIDSDITELRSQRRRGFGSPLIATPIMADGKLYISTAFSQVAAMDAGTGEMLWKYDSGSWRKGRPANMGFRHRGVSYWKDGDDERIIVGTGHSRLIALDAKTGKPIPEFGDDGQIDMYQGLNIRGTLRSTQINSPPVICRDVIVVGCVVADRPMTQKYVRGDIRAFDIRTGKPRWTFRTIPREGEFGVDTWEDGSWKYTGNTNVWTMMSADEELGYVYLPIGAPTNDFYGGHRRGDNLYANCVVCLKVETGERVWHFQTVHHDLWDYDLPCAPNLLDIVVDGKPIKALAQMGKTGYCYVFDRVTGKPVWPIEEVSVPQSTVPGEKTSPTQPVPTKPPPFSAQGLTEDDVIDFTPEIKRQALEVFKKYDSGPIFTPGSLRGTLTVPGDGGGAHWMGASVDPESGIAYVSSKAYSIVLGLAKPDGRFESDMDYVIRMGRASGPGGIPLFKPPYARITAIDLNTGTHTWMKPAGPGIENHPLLKGLNVPPTGGGYWAFLLTTKTMLIVGDHGNLRAVDKATGETIASVPLKDESGKSFGRITGCPLTYMHDGKQYIVAAVTEGRATGRVVGLTLP